MDKPLKKSKKKKSNCKAFASYSSDDEEKPQMDEKRVTVLQRVLKQVFGRTKLIDE